MTYEKNKIAFVWFKTPFFFRFFCQSDLIIYFFKIKSRKHLWSRKSIKYWLYWRIKKTGLVLISLGLLKSRHIPISPSLFWAITPDVCHWLWQFSIISNSSNFWTNSSILFSSCNCWRVEFCKIGLLLYLYYVPKVSVQPISNLDSINIELFSWIILLVGFSFRMLSCLVII